MRTPSAEAQIQFLQNIQCLLDEGSFVATYKYALLLALADLSVEFGDDSGDPLPMPLSALAEKFIQYYWPHAKPLPRTSPPQTLYQNTGKQAAVVNHLVHVQNTFGHSLAKLKQDKTHWKKLIRDIEKTIVAMPLWRLQVIGNTPECFLYPHRLDQKAITLLPGVAYHLRTFHPMITRMIQGAWVANVRNLDRNQPLLGQQQDLSEFLFGSERSNLTTYRDLLLDIDGSTCFYCRKPLRKAVDVDHFIAWSRYPVDLGHNFVLAHPDCNHKKSDHLADEEHLGHWLARNRHHQNTLTDALDHKHLPHDLDASTQIAHWAYQQASTRGSPVWVEKDNFSKLSSQWITLF